MSHNCKRFEGKSVVITAATAGIGLGIAQRLGEEGAKLTICSRRQVHCPPHTCLLSMNIQERLRYLSQPVFELDSTGWATT